MGTAVNLFSLKNYYKIVVPYRAKTICRKFKTCFLKKVPNVGYSWGIIRVGSLLPTRFSFPHAILMRFNLRRIAVN